MACTKYQIEGFSSLAQLEKELYKMKYYELKLKLPSHLILVNKDR